MYLIGTNETGNAAIEWLLKAAELNYGPALVKLGRLCQGAEQIQGVKTPYGRGKEEAVEWFTKAVALNRDDAMVQLGMMCLRGELHNGYSNRYDAQVWFKKAADLGNVHAMTMLGRIYEEGVPRFPGPDQEGPERSGTEALYWYTKAAEQGSVVAMVMIGDAYLRGIENDQVSQDPEPVKPDRVQALEWYSKAADRGDWEGMWGVAGLTEDKGEAVNLLTKAAMKHSEGSYRLGRKFEQEGDTTMAIKYFKHAYNRQKRVNENIKRKFADAFDDDLMRLDVIGFEF